MSAEVQFSHNYRDLCVRDGTGAGFQFEFYCENCSDTWRSPFEAYRAGQASGWLRQVGGFAGGFLGRVGAGVDDAAGGFAQAGYGTARDGAFARAIDRAKDHFNRCPHCHDYVCDRCWTVDSGLCLRCAPDLAARTSVARHEGQVQSASDRARAVGQQRGAGTDVTTDHQLVCPRCETASSGGRFCTGCGHELGVVVACGSCSATLPAGSRFCPQCGTPASR